MIYLAASTLRVLKIDTVSSTPVYFKSLPPVNHVLKTLNFNFFCVFIINSITAYKIDDLCSHHFLDDDDEPNFKCLTYDDVPDDEEQSPWAYLPDLILEKVFSYLPMRWKYYASMVCRTWHRAFYLPYSWSTFVFDEYTLTRRKFNYYSGWQHVLDHLRTSLCLTTVGSFIKVLIFVPMTNFYNVYEFMKIVSYFAEQQGGSSRVGGKIVEDVAKKIHTLKYTFPCNMSSRQEVERVRLYGTGGELLKALKRLMSGLENLRQLELVDLMLDTFEAIRLLDQVCYDCCLTLHTLSLVNATRSQCQLLHVGVFLNLHVLRVSPQNLGEDVLYLIGQTRLQHLHIVQNRYTPLELSPVSPKAWKLCCKANPELRVHLTLETLRDRPLLWQENAPVQSILFSSPQCRIHSELLSRVIEWYAKYLKLFGHLQLPRYHQPKSFNDRTDPLLLMLCREAPLLTTLVIRERVSTATVLLIADHCRKKLKWFFVRKNAVILRCDWPRNPDWSNQFYSWLKKSSQSYDVTEEQVSKLLGHRWRMLPDNEWKNLSPTLY